ncbi:hypothetical protein SAMN05216275_14821 [Streptosporangium canum]|uniref:Uncharacterized protein n=1 Tax=Streptosporangium canum TaxID=324952 RepID=A0A1I4E9G8_9ACTN|nr:hypothetical protein [Streptosporangium canum]SFL02454.1 hypothetical protein SAMN05216275_14821 [Streptosporangium canum]
MDSKRRLTLIGSALLAASALGAATISPASAAPAPVRATGTHVPHSPTAGADPTMGPESGDKPEAYRKAYRKGYKDAGEDCGKGKDFSYDASADWDRKGWVDGYNAGHVQFCEKSG